MNRKIAILRGINVGGKRKILMADLKSMCGKLGLQNVKTYIQSGNLIFHADKQNAALEKILEKGIAKHFGLEVPVIVITEKELETYINSNPFFDEAADINRLHLTFLKAKPAEECIEKIQTFSCEPDQLKIENQAVFIFCAGKYHQSKLTNSFLEKQLKVGATTRNWKTVLKLYELSKIYTP